MEQTAAEQAPKRKRRSRAKDAQAEVAGGGGIGSQLDTEHMAETGEVRAPEPEPEPRESLRAPLEPPTPFAFDAPPHFEPIPQDYLLYVSDRAQGRALLGVLVDEIELPRDRSSVRALMFVLLEPTPLVTADGTLVEGRPGQEVLVEVNHWLRRLVRAARDPQSVGEVWMRSVGRMRCDGGDTLTLWDLRHGRTFPRSSIKRGGAR